MTPTKRTHLRLIVFTLAALLLLVGTVTPARAVEITNNGVLPAGQVIDDDMVISTDKAQIDGTINGDLFLNCSSGVVNGVVNGNLIANCGVLTLGGQVNGSIVFTGQSLSFHGQSTGSLYSFAGIQQLEPTAVIGRNLYTLTGSLITSPGSKIERDLLVNSFQTVINGEIAQDAQIDSEAIEIGGRIGRDVKALVAAPGNQSGFAMLGPSLQGVSPATIPTGLRVKPGAEIAGKLTYTSPVEQPAAFEATPAKGVFFHLLVPKHPTAGDQFVDNFMRYLRNLVTLLILGGLLLWAAPGLLDRLSERARTCLLPATGWGFVTLVMGSAGSLLLFFLILVLGILVEVATLHVLSLSILSLGLLSLSFASVLFLLLIFYGSKLVVAFLIGRLILKRLAPDLLEQSAWPLGVGILVYSLLQSLPVVGIILGIFSTLVGLGTLWLAYWSWRASQPKPALAPTQQAV